MVINHTVNFLPWRRIQFRRDLRRWGLQIGGCWLVCGCMALCAALYWQGERQISELHGLAERQIRQQMQQREQQLKANAQQRAQEQKRRAMRAVTQAWSARLSTLSEHLPSQVWLIELTYRRGALSLAGGLTQFSALSALERELQNLSGFMPAKAERIQRGSDGYWRFQYQLSEAVENAAP